MKNEKQDVGLVKGQRVLQKDNKPQRAKVLILEMAIEEIVLQCRAS